MKIAIIGNPGSSKSTLAFQLRKILNISLLSTLFFIPQCCAMSHNEKKLIIAMGASCSGKSTLSKRLLPYLGGEWKLVELDEIEDAYKLKKISISDDELIDAVINCANENLSQGHNVLIDTNMYDRKFLTIDCECKKIVWVYCPLEVLLARNTVRDQTLQRTVQRARYAQEYVLKTFHNFENHAPYDLKIDSSVLSLDESVEKVITLIS